MGMRRKSWRRQSSQANGALKKISKNIIENKSKELADRNIGAGVLLTFRGVSSA